MSFIAVKKKYPGLEPSFYEVGEVSAWYDNCAVF